ncbi:MAG: BON domain-containing protein [Thermodesulfobacteriota bacterium]
MLKKYLLLIAALIFLAGTAGCNNGGNKSSGEVIDDAVITSNVKTKLFADQDVSGFDVDVDTDKGVVKLSGVVDSQLESNKAESIARKVEGVVSVENNLKINTSGEE